MAIIEHNELEEDLNNRVIEKWEQFEETSKSERLELC